MSFAVASILVTLIIVIFVWGVDTRYRVILTPITLLVAYFSLRILPGYVYAVEVLSIGDELPYLVYLVALVSMVLGWALTLPVYGPLTEKIVSSPGSPLASDGRLTQAWMWFLTAFLVAMGLLLYRGVPPAFIPLVELLRGGDLAQAVISVSDARRELTKAHLFGGAYRGQGALREVLFVGGALVGCYFLAKYLRRRTYRHFGLFLLILVVLYGLVSGDGTRGSFLLVFISLVVTATFITRLPVYRMALIVVGFVSVGILLGAYTPKMHGLIASEGVRAAIFAFLERIAVGNSVNDVLAIEAFRSGGLDTGYGYWFYRDLISAFPGAAGGKPLAYYLYLVTPGGTGATTYLTGTHIMSAYGDFGIVGVSVYFLLIGACLSFGVYLITRLPRTELGVAVTGVTTMLLGQFYVSGLIGVSVQLAIAFFLLFPALLFQCLPQRNQQVIIQ